MPPKRIHSSVTPPPPQPAAPAAPAAPVGGPVGSTTNSNQAAQDKPADSNGGLDKKKTIILDDNDDNPKYVQTVKDNRPLCRYGANCYRKNPDHFREFRHPSKPSSLDEIRSEHEKMKEKARQEKLRKSGNSSSSFSSSSSSSSNFAADSSSSSTSPSPSPPPSPPPAKKQKASTPKKVSSSLGGLDPSKPDDKIDQVKIEAYKVNNYQIIINNFIIIIPK